MKQSKPKIPITIQRGDASFTWHYSTGQVESLSFSSGDNFRYIRGIFGMPFGMCYLDKREAVEDGVRVVYEYMTDLRLTITRTLTDEGLLERYEWQNVGKKEISVAEGELGVYVTFAEKYDLRRVTLAYRAYTHVFAAGKTFYIANVRCNGAPQGVGLVLQEGQIAEVKAERMHPAERGDLIAFMPAGTLAPDETVVWQWLVYPYADADEFWRIATRYAHRIEVNPILPTVGQSVSVKVDGVAPEMVSVDGQLVPNPFPAPAGPFTLAPVEDDALTVLALSGMPHAERWADARHGLSHSKRANPRRHIADGNLYAARFAAKGEQADYDRAVAALYAYYRTLGAYRHPQACMPAALIRSNSGLKEMFARHVATVLKPSKRRYTAQTAIAEYEMLRVADYVFDGEYQTQKQAAFDRLTPLYFTPFGTLYSDEPSGE